MIYGERNNNSWENENIFDPMINASNLEIGREGCASATAKLGTYCSPFSLWL